MLPYVFALGIVAAPNLRIVLLVRHPQAPVAVFVLLPCRMDTLVLGVLAAYFLYHQRVRDLVVSLRRTLWVSFSFLAIGLG